MLFVIMILSRKEKEESVTKLLDENLPYKEIAKRVYMSLSDISNKKKNNWWRNGKRKSIIFAIKSFPAIFGKKDFGWGCH